MAGRNKRAGEEFAFGIVLEQVRGHRCRLAGRRYERQHSVGILGGDVDATIISQIHIEGVDHRLEMPGLGERLLESKGIAVTVVARYVAVFAPRIRDVEVVAHQREAASDVQWMRGRRWIKDQRMPLARRTIILEDADVVDAMPRFTSIANPPHGAVLPETIRCIAELGTGRLPGPSRRLTVFDSCTLFKRFVKSPLSSRIHRVVISVTVNFSKRQLMVGSN